MSRKDLQWVKETFQRFVEKQDAEFVFIVNGNNIIIQNFAMALIPKTIAIPFSGLHAWARQKTPLPLSEHISYLLGVSFESVSYTHV